MDYDGDKRIEGTLRAPTVPSLTCASQPLMIRRDGLSINGDSGLPLQNP
jgi:hypothetical protein